LKVETLRAYDNFHLQFAAFVGAQSVRFLSQAPQEDRKMAKYRK